MSLLIGSIGLFFLLIAFIMNAVKKKETKQYFLLNFIGASLLIYYAFTLNSYPFIILETVWAVFSLYNLF